MITWSYIAGFLDADGWITCSNYKSKTGKKTKNIIYLAGITQLDKRAIFMNEIFEFIKNEGINCKWNRRKQGFNKNNIKSTGKMINITIKEHESLIKFLSNIKDYLLIKKEKATEALTYLNDKRKIKILEKNYKVQERKQKYWKQKEIEILLDLHSLGYSNKAIAVCLNRNWNSIAHKLHRLEIIRER